MNHTKRNEHYNMIVVAFIMGFIVAACVLSPELWRQAGIISQNLSAVLP